MLTFGASETTKTFQVQILGNAVVGGSKTVPLLLSAPGGGASLGSPSTATLTIKNTDEGGSLKFSASSYTVAEDAGSALIAVTRSGGAGSGVTVQVVAADGTAKLNTDYGPPSVGTLTFAANETSKTLTVPILANPTAANSRALTLALKAPGGGASVVSPSAVALTITKAGIRFSATAYTANEGSTATVTVVRKQTTPATVMYRTQDASATAPDDYTAIAPTVLSFASGHTSKTFTVAVHNSAKTTNRQLQLTLSAAAGEALGEPSQATLTILDKQVPDLQLATFAPPPTALVGKPFAVPSTVQNVSAATAGASTLRFVLSANGTLGDRDDVILGARAVGSLAGGATSAATTTLTIPATTAPGTYALFAVVDALNVVAEQDETNNVGQALLTVVARIPKISGLSGDLTQSACTSALRDGQLAAQATLARSNQTGTSLTGTLTITFPLSSGLRISGPVQATVSPDGTLGGTFAYKMTQGSTTLATGTGTLGGSVNAAATTMSLVLTGTHATGETCNFTADLEGPVTPIGFLTFQHDTRVGDLETTDGSFVATPNFPLTIDRNRTLFDVAMDSGFPNPAAVAFVDPNQSASPAATLTQLTPNAAEYAGSWVPGTASGSSTARARTTTSRCLIPTLRTGWSCPFLCSRRSMDLSNK